MRTSGASLAELIYVTCSKTHHTQGPKKSFIGTAMVLGRNTVPPSPAATQQPRAWIGTDFCEGRRDLRQGSQRRGRKDSKLPRILAVRIRCARAQSRCSPFSQGLLSLLCKILTASITLSWQSQTAGYKPLWQLTLKSKSSINITSCQDSRRGGGGESDFISAGESLPSSCWIKSCISSTCQHLWRHRQCRRMGGCVLPVYLQKSTYVYVCVHIYIYGYGVCVCGVAHVPHL